MMKTDTDLGNYINKALLETKWQRYFEAKRLALNTQPKTEQKSIDQNLKKEDEKNEKINKTKNPPSISK